MEFKQRPVDLVHVGYHKCASTSLQHHVFRPCPQIAYTREARIALDPDFNQAEAFWHFNAGHDPKRLVLTSEGLCGVDYQRFDSAEAFAQFPGRIHATQPQAKILLIIRKQPEILRSYYTESIIKFANTQPFAYFYERAFTNHFLNFDEPVARYRELFGSEKVLVLPLEMLKSDQQGFKARLSEHLELDVTGYQIPRSNAGGSLLANEVIRRLNYGFRLVGDQRHIHRAKKHLRLCLGKCLGKRSYSVYGEGEQERLRAYFRESNERTSEMIGIDLIGQYGY